MKRLFTLLIAAALIAPSSALADSHITAVGSTALLPLVKESATQYQGRHPDVKINVSGGGSYLGIAQARSGAADMGDSDVVAPGNAGLVDHKVCVVGFAIAVHPSAGVTNLTSRQIRDVFSGRVTNWNQVGGKDQQIVIINRPRTSGTRAVFTATMMGVSKISETGLTEDSSGAVVGMVAGTPGAVTYVSLSYTIDKPVTVVRINGVAPNPQTIASGRYPIWSYEHIFTRPNPRPEIADFIRFIQTNETVIEKLGYIPISRMRVHETNR